ncbi:uncharacterized protein FTJAE_5385 [Fusarium tjaetaba]|uniref:Uncharacterized protein n=1 Tax=Fusarium tjaetaba TaxID=1567544 RepID=A0A8H5VYL1_9HYPO|nr:uncharacterized protein FTJAE_5385 [Fusarium tjaetaba]KAF5638284.1 hypothetical protein FTJAE_5385 [Fusarium tjaetaba]
MNNFASGAIPNTRVTMRPNLTAGLFLNGRSSTYGRGADIILNDITSIETCGEKGKADEFSQHSTSENSSDQDDVSNGSHTSRSATELQRTTTNDEEGEVQSLADDFPQGNHQNKQQDGFEAHSGSLPSTETTQASDCETPEAMLKRLIETGIFDGTGILETTSHRTMEPNIEHHDCLGTNETKQSGKNPTYQDKGVMADGSRHSTLGPSIQAATKNTQFHLNGGAKDAPVPTQAPCSRYEQELPIPICSTSPQVQPPILPTSKAENHAHSIAEQPCVKQPQGMKTISTTNSRVHPLSQISGKGHSYTEQNDRPDLMFPSLIAGDFNGEHSYHQDSTGKNESQSKDSFVHRGLQSHDIMIPFPGSPGLQQARRPLNGHISGAGLDSAVFPTVHSKIYSDHRDMQHDKRQLTQPDYCEDSETFQEFINRIEGEVGMKWDNSQQSVGVGCVSDIKECAKSESFEMDNSEDLSQCSDIEYDEPIRQSLHGIVSSFDQGSVSANQVMAEDWEHTGYEQSRYWGRNCHNEHGVSDAKMVGFWRPNHF